jgi:simple sugar transport system permease protein
VTGLVVGYLATRSSLDKLDVAIVWGTLFAAMLRYATPLAFAALGGLFSERSGVVNIGLEGMMLTGAFFAVWGSDVTGSWQLGVLIGIASGGLAGLLHAFFSISLRADQIVGGTAINFLALGLTTYLFIQIYGKQGTPTSCPGEPGCLETIPDPSLGFLDAIPYVGGFLSDVFGTRTTYLGGVAVFIVFVVVFRHRSGCACVGWSTACGDTVGINVARFARHGTHRACSPPPAGRLSLGFVNSFEQHDGSGGSSPSQLSSSAAPVRRGLYLLFRVLQRLSTRSGLLDVALDALRGLAVRPHARRRRRRDR